MTDISYPAPTRIPLALNAEKFEVDIFMPSNPSNVLTGVELDTGSTGLVIPASFFYVGGEYTYDAVNHTITGKLLPNVTVGAYTTVTYQPSSDDVEGFVFTIPALTIGNSATTGPITAIGAVGKNPHMMGIGFGRQVLGDNPFLNIQGMADGSVYPSFLLSITKGIWVGCTPETAAQTVDGQFGFQKLTYQPDLQHAAPPPPNSSQWSTPVGTIAISTVNGGSPAASPILIDTGVDLMMVKSNSPGYEQQVAAGTTIAIAISGADGPILSYSFGITGVGPLQSDKTEIAWFTQPAPPMAPTYVLPRGAGDFVNTGFHVLKGYHLYFDALVGQVGYASAT